MSAGGLERLGDGVVWIVKPTVLGRSRDRVADGFLDGYQGRRHGPRAGGEDGGDDGATLWTNVGDGREIDGLADGRGASVRQSG
jgi:hypothetical protein